MINEMGLNCNQCVYKVKGKCAFDKKCSHIVYWDWVKGGWAPLEGNNPSAIQKLKDSQERKARIRRYKNAVKRKR